MMIFLIDGLGRNGPLHIFVILFISLFLNVFSFGQVC